MASQLTEQEQEIVASLTSHAGHRILCQLMQEHADDYLAALENIEDERELVRKMRYWQTFKNILGYIKEYPQTVGDELKKYLTKVEETPINDRRLENLQYDLFYEDPFGMKSS